MSIQSDKYRDAHDATTESIMTARDLLEAFWDLAIEDEYLGTSNQTARSLMAVVRSAKDKLIAAEAQHEAEWKLASGAGSQSDTKLAA